MNMAAPILMSLVVLGGCGRPVVGAAQAAADITGSDEFKSRVLQSDKPAVVDFHATWCGPCKALAPTLEKLAKDYAGKIAFYRVDIDKATQLAEQYKISAVPTLMFFKDGKLLQQTVGLQDEQELKAMLDKLL
jgi:thioredoxin 1